MLKGKLKSLKDKIYGIKPEGEVKPKVDEPKKTRKGTKTMKKTIVTAFLLLAMPALVFAAFKPATLTDGVKKVAVYSQEQADNYFLKGYVLDNGELGNASPTKYQTQYFREGFVFGSRVYATSTATNAGTLRNTDLTKFDIIDFTMNGAAATLTLPASSTLRDFIPVPGMSAIKMIRNATTTAQNITIAGGTGTLLKKQSGGALTITGDTDAANYALILFTRRSDKNIIASMLTFVD